MTMQAATLGFAPVPIIVSEVQFEVVPELQPAVGMR